MDKHVFSSILSNEKGKYNKVVSIVVRKNQLAPTWFPDIRFLQFYSPTANLGFYKVLCTWINWYIGHQ